jgi:phage terminase large subunit-like protein
MLFEADPKKWDDEDEWKRVSPCLGYGAKIENLRDMFTKALHNASERMAFQCKMLNIWVSSSETFIQPEVWQKNMDNYEEYKDVDLTKLPCYGGLDLSSVSDITAFVLVFIHKEKIIIKSHSYLPKENLRAKSKTDGVSYEQWVQDGFMTLTEGNTVDYDYIQKDIEEAYAKYNIKAIGFDRWNSHSIVTRLLEKRVNMIAFGMGWASQSAPVKLIEKTALDTNFVTNDPILRWCISNAVAVKNPAGDVKFDKSKVVQKIDVAVALAIAIGVYIPDMQKPSAYSSRGLRVL